MIKKDLYHYAGRNGFVTTEIFLEGAQYYPMYRLIAEEGKVLTDGEQQVKFIDIFAEDLGKWTEIEENN